MGSYKQISPLLKDHCVRTRCSKHFGRVNQEPQLHHPAFDCMLFRYHNDYEDSACTSAPCTFFSSPRVFGSTNIGNYYPVSIHCMPAYRGPLSYSCCSDSDIGGPICSLSQHP